MIYSLGSISLVSLVLVSLGADPAPRYQVRLKKSDKSVVELAGLDAKALELLARDEKNSDQWSSFFAIHVGKPGDPLAGRLPMGGSYRTDKGLVLFEPRYPLLNHLRYRAVLYPANLPGANAGSKAKPVELEIPIPSNPSTPTAFVEHVFPSEDRLPENQLKFYLHFSAPMSRREAYQRLRLLNDQGKEVPQPFLELDEELWDPTGTRFTLFFDPGRIKRGLKPREDIGPVLEEGKRYTLVIDRRWPDANGQMLKETVRKNFLVLPPEDRLPNPKTWIIETPKPGTTQPLVVTFPRPLDHALLQRLVWVESGDARLDGTIKISSAETRWEFTPKHPWKEGGHTLAADKRLEDLAGNSIGKAFEVDVFRPVQKEPTTEVVKLPFVVK